MAVPFLFENASSKIAPHVVADAITSQARSGTLATAFPLAPITLT